MRRVVTFLLLTLAASASGAQSPARPASQAIETSRALINMENDWARGVVRRDTALFHRMLDPGFVYTEDAAVMNKSDVIKSIREGDRVESASNSDMTVHDHGTTAIVTGILRMRGTAATGRFDRRYRFTDTWMRKNGAWRMIAAQDYLMPK